jgi:hypothetical protein
MTTDTIKTSNVNDVLFNVRTESLAEMSGLAVNSAYSKLVIAETPQGDRIVNACSNDRYEVVACSEFIPQIRNILLSRGLNFEENYKIMDNYSVIYSEFIIKDDRFYIGTPKDVLSMRISVFHSLNGKENYTINMGTLHRYKCTNGLWMTSFDTKEYGLSIGGRHTMKIRKSLQMLEEKLAFVLDNNVMVKLAQQTYQPLFDNWVAKWEDRVIEVMNVAAIGTKTPKGTISSNVEFVKNVIMEEAQDLYGDSNKVNDWLIYNGVNNLLFSDEFKKLESVRVAKDQKVLAELLNN